MIANQIELILIVTGALTASMLVMFVAPLPVLRFVFGEAPAGPISVLLARHWGLLVFSVGMLLVAAAFHPELRVPVLVAAVVEKVGLAACLLDSSVRGQGRTVSVAAGDLLMSCVYVLYLAGF